jgi:Fe-S-cluster containining protein
VFLSPGDAEILAVELKMGYSEFVDMYCRWVPLGGGLERLSLGEKADYDCVFWDQGCVVYKARPLQCRTFPFWPSILASRESWKEMAASCPGMDRGVPYDMNRIESYLEERRRTPLIFRKAPVGGGR